MKRWIRNAALPVLVALVAFVGRRGYQEYAAAREGREREKTMQWLDSVTVPKIDFHDMPLSEAVAFLNRTIADTTGHLEGLHIELASAKETADAFRLKKSDTQPASVQQISEESEEQKITVELTNSPLSAALKYVAGLSNRMIETRGRVVRLHDVHGASGTCDPVVTNTFHLNDRFELSLSQSGTYFKMEPGEHLIDVSKLFSASGVHIYEGDSFELDATTDVLTVSSTQENIDLITALLGSWIEPTIIERVTWWMESFIPTPPAAPLPSGGWALPPPGEGIPGL